MGALVNGINQTSSQPYKSLCWERPYSTTRGIKKEQSTFQSSLCLDLARFPVWAASSTPGSVVPSIPSSFNAATILLPQHKKNDFSQGAERVIKLTTTKPTKNGTAPQHIESRKSFSHRDRHIHWHGQTYTHTHKDTPYIHMHLHIHTKIHTQRHTTTHNDG